MPDQWLVLGGWAAPPVILSELMIRKDPVYIDVNDLFPLLLNNDTLSDTWADTLMTIITDICAGSIPSRILGWSTGAMIASALSCITNPSSLILLSGTTSFVTRPGQRHGVRPGVLHGMRERFALDRDGTMRDFARQCAIAVEDEPVMKQGSARYETSDLDAGLAFLSQIDLRETLRHNPGTRASVFHGSDDRIIPWQAGESLAHALGGEFVSMDGGHLFFRSEGNAAVIRGAMEGGGELRIAD